MTKSTGSEPSRPWLETDGPITRDQFRRLADRVLTLSPGEHTFVALRDSGSGTTRFANNQIVQNVNTRRMSLAVTVAFGRQHGTSTVTDFGEEAIRDTVRKAADIARVSPVDPEYMPPLPPQDYAAISTAREDTAAAGPQHRLALVGEAIDLCRAAQLIAAGIVTSSLTAVGVAANTGLFAYEPRTEAHFSVTAMGGDSSGWAANVHRSLQELEVAERTRVAIEKATRSVNPRELPPGRYTVILEPAAVSGLIGPMIWMLDAKSFYKRTNPFSGKLGRQVIDPRLSLQNRPDHSELLGNGFNGEGLPAGTRAWIENGVLKELRYDRYTAQEHHVHPTPSFDAPYLFGTPLTREFAAEEAAGAGTPGVQERAASTTLHGQDLAATKAAGAEAAGALDPYPSLDDLIRTTERGILVTNFWYIRSVNPTDLTLTGMTRDGTFLIEDGRLSTGLVNFRWHESPLRVLAHVDAFTAPADAVTNESWKMQLPALKLHDFNFSSVTRF
jgi:predicted Zn-dependent protease